MRRLGDIITELLQLVGHAVRHPRLEALVLQRQPREALGQERHRAAGVREDPADVGEAGGGAAEDDARDGPRGVRAVLDDRRRRSEEHTSELQSLAYLVCRLLLEKKNKIM